MAKKELTFEEAMNRLSTIVSTLEQNDQPLDTTIDLFEEGLNLVKSCESKLKNFESKIEEIQKRSEDHE
ncbi:MAG: exodeoxyribonuclease VII small subunit [Erysipelotrichaceae bacterium]|nr:exodeoxyribonuclease VII small subunit [Erysipelotrichaceae bacterium]